MRPLPDLFARLPHEPGRPRHGGTQRTWRTTSASCAAPASTAAPRAPSATRSAPGDLLPVNLEELNRLPVRVIKEGDGDAASWNPCDTSRGLLSVSPPQPSRLRHNRHIEVQREAVRRAGCADVLFQPLVVAEAQALLLAPAVQPLPAFRDHVVGIADHLDAGDGVGAAAEVDDARLPVGLHVRPDLDPELVAVVRAAGRRVRVVEAEDAVTRRVVQIALRPGPRFQFVPGQLFRLLAEAVHAGDAHRLQLHDTDLLTGFFAAHGGPFLIAESLLHRRLLFTTDCCHRRLCTRLHCRAQSLTSSVRVVR